MRRILLIPAIAALGVLGLTATPAQAATTISSITLSTNVAVINGDSGCGDRIKVTVKIDDPDKDSLGGHVEMSSATGGDSPAYEVFNSSRDGDTAVYSAWLWICGWNADPGKYYLHILIYGIDQDLASDTTPVWIKRPTSLTYNAHPEPVRAGGYLTHSGRLMFDPFAPGPMYGPSGVQLKISFKKAGTSTYSGRTYVTTKSGGYYSIRWPAYSDGIWRIEYPTNTYRQTQYKYDFVDVQ